MKKKLKNWFLMTSCLQSCCTQFWTVTLARLAHQLKLVTSLT